MLVELTNIDESKFLVYSEWTDSWSIADDGGSVTSCRKVETIVCKDLRTKFQVLITTVKPIVDWRTSSVTKLYVK